ncbi:MAG: hypothetical protein JNK85_13840 [Verrucomicrobiales bacterium]|nr:hypothetical protein [Verrucomicrobiales bacterium]
MLHRFLRAIVIGMLALAAVPGARGFALLGPFDDYQTAELYYDPNPTIYNFDDIGGPQNLGEEYRWGIPTIYYAYDSAFLEYFGQDGVDAVEKAIKVFNDLPAASAMSDELNEFPLATQKINHRAAALGMLDLKSGAMLALTEMLGLTHAERFVWTMRDRDEISPPGCPFYVHRVIKRSFDPVTWLPTSYVNGVLYTYLVMVSCDPAWSDAREFPVDPTAISHTSLSSWFYGLQFGGYYTGLTRDDAGGFRYLYRANNFNVEDVPAGSTVGFGLVSSGGGGGGSGSWTPISPPSTNVTDTNAVPNQPATLLLRPGVEKIRFVRANYDSILGNTFRAITNIYTSQAVTNSRLIAQTVRRPVTVPDILFSAGDSLDGNVNRSDPAYIESPDPDAGTVINGLNGPGVIPPAQTISFNKNGPRFGHGGPPLVGEDDATVLWVWGSFDGTTNAPIVYPFHTSIKELESQVLGR